MTSIVSFTLPNLPDVGIAFANNAAWQAYWQAAALTISVTPATTVVPGTVLQAATTAFTAGLTTNNDYYNIQTGQGNVMVPQNTNFDQLKTALNTLVTDYVATKTALVAAGIITQV